MRAVETVECWCNKLLGDKMNLVLDITLIVVSIMGLVFVVVFASNSWTWFAESVAVWWDEFVNKAIDWLRHIYSYID